MFVKKSFHLHFQLKKILVLIGGLMIENILTGADWALLLSHFRA